MDGLSPRPDEEGDPLSDTARRDLAAWRAAHPDATFAELETVVEERVRRVRGQMLDLLLTLPVCPATDATAAPRTRCPVCGETMQARGSRTRPVTVAGDQTLLFTRAYVVCPGCRTGLFPP